jgi:2-aminoadipate transaminase
MPTRPPLLLPLDDDGMMVDELEDTVQRCRPKFIYVLPNFHNPAGVSLSEERRHKLAEVALATIHRR